MRPWAETEGLGEISPGGGEGKTGNGVIICGVDWITPFTNNHKMALPEETSEYQ